MIKKILLLLIIPLYLISGSIIINKNYIYDLFNMELKNIPEIYTYSDIEKALNEQYGILLYSSIPEIEGNKRYFNNNKLLVGDFLSEIADSFEATATYDEKKGYIKFNQLFSTFTKFPAGWNLDDTLNDLQLNNPNISFKINGNRIYAYGSEKQIDDINPLMQNLEYITNKNNMFVIKVLKYSTKEKEKEFIGYKKGLGNEVGYDDGKIYIDKIISLKHNDTFGFQFQDQFINIKLNMVKETLVFNNYYEIPLSELTNLGYVFTSSETQEKTFWGDNENEEKYIVEITPSQF